MNGDTARQAINAALTGDWQKAIESNNAILSIDNQNIDAKNRLARAFFEIGNVQEAIKLTKDVLYLDPVNSIAKKSLEKYKAYTPNGNSSFKPADPSQIHKLFLEEPGKTKVVTLINLGDNQLLLSIPAGISVKLSASQHKISVTTDDGKYLGRLPDDVAIRLVSLMKQGNEYESLIKCCHPQEVKVFIRETKRSKELSSIPSFSIESRTKGSDPDNS